MTIPILAATAGIEGRWSFTPVVADDGASIIIVRFIRPGRADLFCQYGAVFTFALVDGLIARGDLESGRAAADAAVRAIELKHARRRLVAARAALESDTFPPGEERSAPVSSVVAPAGAGLPDLPPAGGSLNASPQP